MPLMLHLERWGGIRHAKTGKKYVAGRGSCRCQGPEAGGTCMLEECKKVLVAGAQCTSWLPPGSRCGYLLDNHSPIVHLTNSTQARLCFTGGRLQR